MDQQTAVLKFALSRRQQTGARVLYWVAGLSLLNTVLIMTKANVMMVCGLGITAIFDYMAAAHPVLGPLALVVDVVALLFFAAMGRLATRGQDWALWVGMIMYALDGVLMLVAGDALAAGFHAWLLYSAWGGLQASHRLRQIARLEAAAQVSPQ